MIDLVFITESYPYNDAKEATFIEPELECYFNELYSEKINITFLPLRFEKAEEEKGLVVSTLLRDILNNKITLVSKVLIFNQLYKELFIRLFSKKGKCNLLKDIKAIVNWSFKYQATMKALSKLIENSEKKKMCIYSYWFNGCTSAAIDFNKKYLTNSKVITRAHGYDLYNAIGWQTRRAYDIECLDSVYPVSIAGKKELQKLKDSKNIKTLYLGVKGIDFFGKEKQFCENEIRVCSCSYIVPVKRVPLLLEGLVCLSEQYRDKKIQWEHYGNGADSSLIENLIKRIPGNLEVILKGEVDNYEIRNSMHANNYSAFVNTSSSEGLPVSLMEALEAGIPLVATDVGGCSEIVSEDVGRLIAENPTPSEIADAIYVCHENRHDLSLKALQNWKERFNSEINHKSFFNDIIGFF